MLKTVFKRKKIICYITTLLSVLIMAGCSLTPSGILPHTNPDDPEYVPPNADSTKTITAFTFTEPAVSGSINETTGTITVIVPAGTDRTDLTPTITHTGATIVPESDSPQDFTSSVTYTVTAEDKTTAAYLVMVMCIPNVTTTAITDITTESATSGGSVTSEGGSSVTARGVCWNTSENPVVTDSHTTDESENGSFTSSISGLYPGTEYHVRAYATNYAGTAYGEDLSFTTDPDVPSLTTAAVSNITGTTAESGGEILSNGGSEVTARGVCWSTLENPTTADYHSTDGTGTGSFSSGIDGISTGNTYYVRAYATNGIGTAYGDQVSFSTALPSITTTEISGNTTFTIHLAGTSARGGGTVTDQGGSDVTERGLCWNTTGSPTLSDSSYANGSGTGEYTAVLLTGLTADNVYYVRAYATSSIGTSYGNQISFDSGKTFGTTHEGGKVFYNDGSGGGLVAESEDLPDEAAWSNITTTYLGSTGTAIGTGSANTDAITGQSGHTAGAAQVCRDYAGSGYTDWFLPSREELNLLYDQRTAVGGFSAGSYWSSSEYNSTFAWVLSFGNGDRYQSAKGSTVPNVRPVRSF